MYTAWVLPGKSSMISMLYFDTDCFSSFLWVKKEDILFRLYPGRVLLPRQVYIELSNPSVPHFKTRVNQLRLEGRLSTKEILVDTEEYRLYYALAISPPAGKKVIGKGEAAAIALAKTHCGILASNNLSDVAEHVDKYRLKHLTTGDILVAALINGHIDEMTGNYIWDGMKEKKRMLPTDSFTEYLEIVDHPD